MMLLNPVLDNSFGENWETANIVFGAGDYGTPGEANYQGECAESPWDMNNDGVYNVLDVVTLVNCVLAGTCDCSGDLNEDSDYNILDIVMLTNCILAENCDE